MSFWSSNVQVLSSSTIVSKGFPWNWFDIFWVKCPEFEPKERQRRERPTGLFGCIMQPSLGRLPRGLSCQLDLLFERTAVQISPRAKTFYDSGIPMVTVFQIKDYFYENGKLAEGSSLKRVSKNHDSIWARYDNHCLFQVGPDQGSFYLLRSLTEHTNYIKSFLPPRGFDHRSFVTFGDSG